MVLEWGVWWIDTDPLDCPAPTPTPECCFEQGLLSERATRLATRVPEQVWVRRCGELRQLRSSTHHPGVQRANRRYVAMLLRLWHSTGQQDQRFHRVPLLTAWWSGLLYVARCCTRRPMAMPCVAASTSSPPPAPPSSPTLAAACPIAARAMMGADLVRRPARLRRWAGRVPALAKASACRRWTSRRRTASLNASRAAMSAPAAASPCPH